ALSAREPPSPIHPLFIPFVDLLPAILRQTWNVIDDVEAVLLAFDPLDLVECDDHIVWYLSSLAEAGHYRRCRRRQNCGIGEAAAGELDNLPDLRLAGTAAGARPRRFTNG